MPRLLISLIYNLLLPVVLFLGLPAFLIKGIRRGGLARNFRQRLGYFSAETLARFRDREPIWIHAVSVGEIFIALKLIEAIRAAASGQHIVLSTTTTTGYRVAVEKESDFLTVIHNPVDLPWITSRVIRLIRPSCMVLVEAEIWPNLVAQLKNRGTPVLLINARLSPRSEKRYLQFRPLIEPIFSLLDGATVPFEVDRDRWSRLGIRRENIVVTGSVKFDHIGDSRLVEQQCAELDQWLTETGMPDRRRILLGGSTHDGEELLIAQIAESLRSEVPDLKLVLVPRHAERGATIASQLEEAGFAPILRAGPERVSSDTQEGTVPREKVWIANTTGELRSWFHLAEVVVIGKSFYGGGGQNPVEPILAGKPVVVGPRMENFADVVQDLLAVSGIVQVGEKPALGTAVAELFRDPGAALGMAGRGAAAMARHDGAAQRNAAYILSKFEER
jgi:3-deoxy-D-manno-octulosonic-acid transferase